MSMELCWWPLSAWISPGAALFVFFNVLVGAVAFMSREHQPGGGVPPSRRRLRRSASSMILDRLRSFSMFPIHPAAECYYSTATEAEKRQDGVSTAHEPALQVQATTAPPSAPVLTVAADVVPPATPESEKDEAEAEDKSAASVDQADVRGQVQHAPESPLAQAAAADKATAAVERPGKKKQRRRRARTRDQEAEEVVDGKAELNARAELFIRQFREDLKLQGLNSIINYTRALRHHCGGAASEEN